MIGIPGDLGKDLCDAHLPMSRRDVLKVGGSGMLGLTLGSMLDPGSCMCARNFEADAIDQKAREFPTTAAS